MLPFARRRPELAGRVAVVTGAGSGIGRSIALLLAEGGCAVHVADRDGAAAIETAAAITGAGGAAMPHTVDVTIPEAVEGLADAVFAAGQGCDYLFNNAGVGHAGLVEDTPLADWRTIVEVNLMGVVHGVHAFLPRLLAQDRPAHIVNTASMAGLVPNPGMVPYSTSKAAVVGMSEALDAELAPKGIRVTALCPGVIDTAIVRTSVVRGAWATRHDALTKLYATRGTSPDVVAAAALDAIARGRTIMPTPRYQVTPQWLLKRLSPGLSRALSAATMKAVGPKG